MGIAVDDLLHGGIDELVLGARREDFRQGDGLLAGGVEGLDMRAHPRHGGIVFAVTVTLFREAHGRKQRLQMFILERSEMPVRIHREYQQIEQRLLLGRAENGNIQIHESMMRQPGRNNNATRDKQITRPKADNLALPLLANPRQPSAL